MTHRNSMALPGHDADTGGRHRQEARRGEDSSRQLAEAIDILADRAMRHGFVEVAHLLGVAALAARDSAAPLADQPGQPEDKPNALSTTQY